MTQGPGRVKSPPLTSTTLIHSKKPSPSWAKEIASDSFHYTTKPINSFKAISGNLDSVQSRPIKTASLSINEEKSSLAMASIAFAKNISSQRGQQLTRHGIYRICKKYLIMALPPKRLTVIHPAHSFRHTKVMDMLYEGKNLAEVRNHLGHDTVQSTMIYTHMDIKRKRQIQKRFIRYMDSTLSEDPKLNELLSWENEKDLMDWLDSL
jgi:hypothetical protein